MTEDLMLDDGDQLIPSLLKLLVYEDNVMKRLQAMDTLCSAIEEDISEMLGVKKFKKHLNDKYLNDILFLRKLKLYSKMNENVETAIEYHGQDYLTHPEFIFDLQFEKEVNKLTKAINEFTGQLLKEYSKGDTIEI